MSLITVAELLERPGFDGIATTEAQALIEDATALVRDAARGALDDVESPDTPPSVVAVLVSMVRRGRSNPLGYSQAQLGDFGYSVPTPATLYLTKRERRIVRRAVGVLGVASLNMTGHLPQQPSEPDIDDEIIL